MFEINRSLAIIIGIDKYQHIPPLKNARADAFGLANVLTDTYGYEVLLLLDQRASKEKLDELVVNLQNKIIDLENKQIQVKERDRILFYFERREKNGQILVSASWDGTVKLWNRDGSFRQTLRGQGSPLLGVAFSPDGKRLASSSNDKTVNLWNLDLDLDIHGLRNYTGNWMRDYLKNNPNVSESDRNLCDHVPKVVAKDKSF